MKYLNALLSLVALLGLMVLAGCTAAPSLLGLGARSESVGTALVTLSGWTRQTQAVAADVSTVSLSVSPLGGNPFYGKRKEVASSPTGSASAAFSGLSAGVWRVEAVALGVSRDTLGTATADVTIQAGQTATVTMALRLAATNGLQLQIGARNGYVRWNELMPEAREPMQVAADFANTFLGWDGNQWRYVLTDATGTRSATYSVYLDPVNGTSDLLLDVEGQARTARYVDLEGGLDELHAMPLGAQLVATGSESVLGQVRPFRKFEVTLRYPYPGDQWVQLKTTRWVTPGIGTYREETTAQSGATTSLVLTGYTLRP